MFKLRGQRFVAGDGCPVIGQHLGLSAAQIYHRLDREKHAFFQHCAGPCTTIMQHIWRRMEHPAKPVAAEIAHHRHAVGFDKTLDRVTDIAKGVARFYGRDPKHQRVMRDLDQPTRLARQIACHIHAAVVAKPAIDDHRHINIGNIAVSHDFRAGDTVANHMVDRNTRRVAVAFVADGGRGGTAPFHFSPDIVIQSGCGHAGLHQGCHAIQNFRSHLPGCAHAREIRILVNANAVFGDARAGMVQENVLLGKSAPLDK